jgi:outer membrane protein OmpA-like peptidoglycan-associated protein
VNSSPRHRGRARPRRGLRLLLATLLTTLASVAGVTLTTAPAHAEPLTCEFVEYDADGAHWADLVTNGTVWLFTWVDGEFWGWHLTNENTVRVDAQQLQTFGGTHNLTYRVYPADADQTAIANDPEWPSLCEVSYEPPAPTPQNLVVNYPDDLRLGRSQNLVATSDSGLPVAFESRTPSVCSVTDLTVTGLVEGECTVRASQPGGVVDGVTYAAAPPVDRTFEIWPVPATQTITFVQPADMRLGDRVQALTATASSRLNVQTESLTPSVCTVDSHGGDPTRTKPRRIESGQAAGPLSWTVAAVSPGQCTLRATQGGNADWDWVAEVFNPAHAVERTFTVRGATPDAVAQSVAVSGSRGVALSAGSAPVRFTSSAGLPVQVASSTPAVCTWKNGSARLHQAGTCSLSATAAGNAAHLAAPAVRTSFPVWGHPALPNRSKSARVLDVLGRGEERLRVSAGPAGVCRAVSGGKVALTDAGRCTVRVTARGERVRTERIRVVELTTAAAKPEDMSLAGSVRFAYRSADLTADGRKTLRRLAPKLRDAQLVAVYGNTQAYGAGDTPANRKLSARRAAAVVAYLRDLGVKAKTTKVALASRNPAGRNEAANRRADIYWVR